MAKKTSWTDQDYKSEAEEFVACYGNDHCWDEFVEEYCRDWEHSQLRAPDPDMLRAAIHRALP